MEIASQQAAPVVADQAGFHETEISIPIIGVVTAGSGWAEPSQDPDDWKPIPIRSHWRAVRIQGDSGHLIYGMGKPSSSIIGCRSNIIAWWSCKPMIAARI